MRKTALIVDDDQEFCGRISSLLASEGYRPERACDGRCALALIERLGNTLDLAIVDLALPFISGYEVIGIMRRRPSKVKILATSAVFKEPYLEAALEVGADAALRKQASDAEWLGAIRSINAGAASAGN